MISLNESDCCPRLSMCNVKARERLLQMDAAPKVNDVNATAGAIAFDQELEGQEHEPVTLLEPNLISYR